MAKSSRERKQVRLSSLQLKRLYEVNKMDAEQIAKMLGVTGETVRTRLSAAGVQIRNRSDVQLLRSASKRSPLFKSRVIQLYYREGRSMRDVAATLEVSRAMLERFMKRHDMPRRLSSYSPYAESRFRKVPLDEAVVMADYATLKTLANVARKHRVATHTIRRILLRNGVDTRGNRRGAWLEVVTVAEAEQFAA